MPKPGKSETRKDFVGRCVPQCVKEGLSQKQAVGKCEGIYSHAKRGGMAKAARGES